MTTDLIDPVKPAVLAAELRSDFCVDSFRGLEVMLFTAAEAPQTMREIGRIREKAFREAGAGRNLATDLDARDFGDAAYRQLVVWDPVARQIVAAYRYICCGDHDLSGDCPHLRTSDLFSFSSTFRQQWLPHLIELGRSVVNKQAKRAALGLFATWKGLAALLCEYPDIVGFYGNFSVYRVLPTDLIDAMLAYLDTYHRPVEAMLAARPGLQYVRTSALQKETSAESHTDDTKVVPPDADNSIYNDSLEGRALSRPDHQKVWQAEHACRFLRYSRADAFVALQQQFRERGERLPPILLSYLGAAPGLQYLGAALDHDFGDALECAILIRREDLAPKVQQQFLAAYRSTNPTRFQQLRKR